MNCNIDLYGASPSGHMGEKASAMASSALLLVYLSVTVPLGICNFLTSQSLLNFVSVSVQGLTPSCPTGSAQPGGNQERKRAHKTRLIFRDLVLICLSTGGAKKSVYTFQGMSSTLKQ